MLRRDVQIHMQHQRMRRIDVMTSHLVTAAICSGEPASAEYEFCCLARLGRTSQAINHKPQCSRNRPMSSRLRRRTQSMSLRNMPTFPRLRSNDCTGRNRDVVRRIVQGNSPDEFKTATPLPSRSTALPARACRYSGTSRSETAIASARVFSEVSLRRLLISTAVEVCEYAHARAGSIVIREEGQVSSARPVRRCR